MAQNKEQLNLLSEFVKDICSRPENISFTNELKQFLGLASSDSENEMISEIYELCLARNLENQAKSFYANFPIATIKDSLVEDFISMENHRRMGEFEEFGLALFQQIERVTNYIVRVEDVDELARKMMFQPACRKHSASETPEAKRIRESNKVADLLFYNYSNNENTKDKPFLKLSSHYIMDKIKCVCYFVCEKGYIYSSYDFWHLVEEINKIYQIRNKVHRGGDVSDRSQKILDEILPEKERYYIPFICVLKEFMDKIEAGYPLSEELVAYASTLG